MNIKAIAIAAAAAVFSALAVSAQGRGHHRNYCNPQPCAVSNRCDSLCTRPDSCRLTPFDGIALTADQKAKLQQACPATRRADSKDLSRERRNARKEYLAKVKSILTPEQYTQFLENNFVNGKPGARRGGKAGQGRGRQGRAARYCGAPQCCPYSTPAK